MNLIIKIITRCGDCDRIKNVSLQIQSRVVPQALHRAEVPELQSLDVVGTFATLEGVRCIASSLPALHSLSLLANFGMEMDKVAGAVKGMKALSNVMVDKPSTKAERRAMRASFRRLNISMWFGP